MSFFAIIYLFSSNNPYFKWLAVTLIGWCLMQFAELLLWLTDPRKGCTPWNHIITMTLIPFVLMLQPIGPLLGSLYVIPWNASSDFRKYFLIFYSIFIIALISVYHLYKPYKTCTTVTPGGRLYWSTEKYSDYNILNTFSYSIWAILIALPLFVFWDKSIVPILLLLVIPIFGFFNGHIGSDSRASIWCYYTSYTSIIASVFLFLKQTGIYSIV